MKTSKCHLIYRNVSKTSDRNNEKNLKVDKIEFFWNFPRNVFCALLLPCLRGLKSVISATMSALYHLPATTNLSMFGKWFLVRFFGILHCRFLITSRCRAPPPTLKPENCDGWLLHAPGAPTNKMSSGDEVATHWLPSRLARSSPVSQAGSAKILRSTSPQLQPCSPTPPRDANTPWSTASQPQNVNPPFQHRAREDNPTAPENRSSQLL